MSGGPSRVGLIGLGMVAETHAAAIAATGGKVRIVAVHSRNLDDRDGDPKAVARAESFAARHADRGNPPRVCRALDDMLSGDGIDFAILATPPDARLEIVAALAERRVPVLCEKPLGRNLAEARQVVEICARHGTPLGAVLQHRARPAARRLLETIRNGELGEIATMEARIPWWRDQDYYAAPGRGTYARDGGGVLVTQAIHTLDLAIQCCGPARDVQAVVQSSALHDMEAEDFAAAGIRFRSGVAGSIMASVTHYPGEPEEIALNGTLGSARLGPETLEIRLRGRPPKSEGPAAGADHDGTGSGGGANPMAFPIDWHRTVIEEFADAIRAGQEPPVSGDSALDAHALVDAILRSSNSGRRETAEGAEPARSPEASRRLRGIDAEDGIPGPAAPRQGARATRDAQDAQDARVPAAARDGAARIRMAVIGIDHRHACAMVSHMRDAGCELVCWQSPGQPGTLEEFVGEFPNVRRVEREEDVLGDPSIDLVLTAAVPCLRAEISIRAMRAGKDVLSDKPGCLTRGELASLRDAVRETGRFWAVNFAERFEVAAMTRALELVRDGAIGEVVQVTGFGPHRLGAESRPDWFWDPARNGGILVDIGSHQVDQALALTGADTAEIVLAHARKSSASASGPEPWSGAPHFQDYGEIVLQAGRARAFLRVDWHTPDAMPVWGDGRVFVTGTEGSIELRKYVDVGGADGRDHLFLTNRNECRRIDASGAGHPFFPALVRDIRERTESAMPQERVFAVCDLAIQAQEIADKC